MEEIVLPRINVLIVIQDGLDNVVIEADVVMVKIVEIMAIVHGVREEDGIAVAMKDGAGSVAKKEEVVIVVH